MNGWSASALVFLGAGIGAVGRYWVGLTLNWTFPWGTLTINVLGGLMIGVLVGAIGPQNPALRLLIIVGLLGGFTTFSSYSLETIELIHAHRALAAATYVLASNIGAIGACAAGLWARGQLMR